MWKCKDLYDQRSELLMRDFGDVSPKRSHKEL